MNPLRHATHTAVASSLRRRRIKSTRQLQSLAGVMCRFSETGWPILRRQSYQGASSPLRCGMQCYILEIGAIFPRPDNVVDQSAGRSEMYIVAKVIYALSGAGISTRSLVYHENNMPINLLDLPNVIHMQYIHACLSNLITAAILQIQPPLKHTTSLTFNHQSENQASGH